MSGDMDGNDSDGSTATEDGPDTARSGALDVADEPTATDQPWIDDQGPFPTADDDGEDDWPPRPPPPSTVQRDRVIRSVLDAVVVVACAAYVFGNLPTSKTLSSALPAGGDMGAHVWGPAFLRSEEHTSELQSLMRISYAVFCLKKK